jgi:GGDEF domain-containing protein
MRDADLHGPRRPRPVADAPVGSLLARDAGAQAWLLRLVASGSLEASAGIPVAELVARGPALCAAVLRALGSDAELARLGPHGDLATLAAEAGALGGARAAPAAAAVVEALRAALWEELRNELRRPPAELVADLAERLAHVCSVVAAAALAAAPAPVDAAAPEWWAPIARGLAQQRRGAVIAIDVDDADRLLAADLDGEMTAALQRVGQRIAGLLDDGDALIAAGPGRHWVVAEAERAAALADLIAATVADAGVQRGVALRSSVGVAVAPADGGDAETLAIRAEERALAARAQGRV